MNGGAYGGDFAQVLERALVATADGIRLPDARGARALVPALEPAPRPGRRRRPSCACAPRDPVEIKAEVRELNARRKAAQPTNRRTFGSVFKNPEHELTRRADARGVRPKGHRIGGAQISPKHANFIENAGGARTADAIALMAEARRRAHEQYGVELGTRSSSSASSSCRRSGRSARARGEPGRVAGQRRPVEARAPRARAAAVALPRAERRRPCGARAVRSVAPLARGRRSASSRSPPAPTPSRGRRSAFAIGRVEVSGAPASVQQQVQARARAVPRHEPARARRRRARAACRGAPDRRLRQLRPRLPAHAPHPGRARAPGRRAPPRQGDLARLGAGEGGRSASRPARIRRSRGSGCRARPTVARRRVPRAETGGTAARAARARGALPGAHRDRLARPRRARLPAPLRARAPARRSDRRPRSSSRSPAGRSRSFRRARPTSTSASPAGPSPVSTTLNSQVEVETMNAPPLIDTEFPPIYPAPRPSFSCPDPLLKLQVSAL